ncbi:MAG: hypothetical protein ABIH83_01075 [Candidatus Micrarchaeota archaeon]
MILNLVKKFAPVVLALLILASAANFAQKNVTELIEAQIQNPLAYWVTNYEAVAILAAIIAIILVALLYFASKFFESEEMAGLAKTELVQAVAGIIILIIFLAFVNTSDWLINYSAENIKSPCLDPNFNPPPQATTINKYAACYTHNLKAMAVSIGKKALGESVKEAREAYSSWGYQSNTIYLLYTGISGRFNAHKRLDSEINGLEFDLATIYITSLEAQEKFLNNIVPVLGPSALLIGIVLRSFFFTRKLGGLLLAISIGLMIILPACYLLAWYTLQVAAYGGKAIGEPESLCPEGCKVLPPWGYLKSKNIDGAQLAMGFYDDEHRVDDYGVYSFADVEEINLKRVENGKEMLTLKDGEAWMDEEKIQVCFPRDNSGWGSAFSAEDSANCPAECRYLPTPTEINCDQSACDKIPAACKAVRAMTEEDFADYCTVEKNKDFACYCPEDCMLDLPFVEEDAGAVNKEMLESKFMQISENANKFAEDPPFDCTKCPVHCRGYYSDIEPQEVTHAGQDNACDKECANCFEAKPDVLTGIPSLRTTTCNSEHTCGDPLSARDAIAQGRLDVCPIECRAIFDGVDEKYKDPYYIYYCEQNFKKVCEGRCPEKCKIKISDVVAMGGCSSPPKFENLAGRACTYEDVKDGWDGNNAKCLMEAEITANCARCPLACRFVNPSSIPEYKEDDLDTEEDESEQLELNENNIEFCSDPDVRRFCTWDSPRDYCNLGVCGVDRETEGPFLCEIEDLSYKYSNLPNNEEYCGTCYTINSAKTTGPQCQVLLYWQNEEGEIPAECSDACNPGTTNARAGGQCNGFCYPRLEIPSGGSCGEYDENSRGEDDRSMVNGAACPLNCRYDYMTKSGEKMPNYALQACGYELDFSDGPKECDTRCEGRVYGTRNKDWCEGRRNANAVCNSDGRTSRVWYHINSAPEVPDMTSSCPCEDDNECNQNTCEDSRGVEYTIGRLPIYSCQRQQTYDGWDAIVRRDTVKANYIECGTIDKTNNQDLNFCGKKTVLRRDVVGLASECKAEYNARAVACLPKPPLDLKSGYWTDEQVARFEASIQRGEPVLGVDGGLDGDGSDVNCVSCPLPCRVNENTDYQVCKEYAEHSNAIDCESQVQCDLRAMQNSPPEVYNPIGYCGVDGEAFNLDNNLCEKPLADKSAACPARCRLSISGALPVGCGEGEIADACKYLKQECTAQVKGAPCAECDKCAVVECTAKPYAWTESCTELCTADDLELSLGQQTPEALLSTIEGANARYSDWQTLGALGVASFVLPIFCMIITIAFIRTLSPLLGGDIEIPGIMKLI